MAALQAWGDFDVATVIIDKAHVKSMQAGYTVRSA